MVIEGRRDQARPDVEQPEQVTVDGRPGVLASRHQAVANRHLARADTRPTVHLALAPAALAGVAHQPSRSMEPEAARQDRAVGSQQGHRERLTLDPSTVRPSNVNADPAPWGARRRVRMRWDAT